MSQSSIRVIFGMKLKRLRQERGLSLQEFSKVVGLSVSYLNEIENGKKYPKAEKIQQIAEALDLSYDELVSQRLQSELGHLEQVLSSSGLRKFPFHLFGITLHDVVALLPNAPKEGRAFVKAMLDTVRAYDLKIDHFLQTALRCYQEMHNNYFEDLEQAVEEFRSVHKISESTRISTELLYGILRSSYSYEIDETTLGATQHLCETRSVWIDGDPPKLLINNLFSDCQKAFMAGRELGYLALGIDTRGHCSPDIEVDTFEQVLNAFRASYFSSALCMPVSVLQQDIAQFFSLDTWQPDSFLGLIDKYDVTPEMFFYRLSELLPKFFNINRLHFLRFNHVSDSKRFVLVKQLNMSQVHIPTGIDLNEHFCRRWLSLSIIEELERAIKSRDAKLVVGAQRSQFMGSDEEFFCICIARPLALSPTTTSSITIGFHIDDTFKRTVKFWDDPTIAKLEINETCERCPLTPEQCTERAAAPKVFQREQKLAAQRDELEELLDRFAVQ